LDEARVFAAAGADFVLVSDLVWSDSRGAAAALMDIANAIRQARASERGRTIAGPAEAGQG
jgi:thiamine-phosphate pyrophosphorylase